MTKMKKLTCVLIAALLMCCVFLSGCDPVEESAQSKELCESFLDYVIANDPEAAYGTTANVNRSEFDTLWDYVRNSLEGAKSYELKQVGWHTKLENGVSYTSVTFELTTDNERTCYIAIITLKDTEGIAGLNFVDSTEFIEKTAYANVVDAVLKSFSCGLLVLSIWMLIDCIKRRIKNKALWIVLIVLGVGFSLTLGGGNLGFKLEFGLLLYLSGMAANAAAHTVTTKLIFPIGAVIYMFMRKKLTLVQEEPIDDAEVKVGEIADGNAENAENTEVTAETENAPDSETPSESDENNE